MAKEKRFECVYKQGGLSSVQILRDTKTGVEYLYVQSGYSGGLTPLLDREGKSVVSATGAHTEF